MPELANLMWASSAFDPSRLSIAISAGQIDTALIGCHSSCPNTLNSMYRGQPVISGVVQAAFGLSVSPVIPVGKQLPTLLLGNSIHFLQLWVHK